MKYFPHIVLLLTHSVFALGSSVHWIPKGRPFRLAFADPREIRMMLAMETDTKLNAAIGNYFSILGIRNEKSEMHVGIEGAGYFTMRQSDRRYPLESTDGLIGIYLEESLQEFQWQIRYTHVSAHLSDGSSQLPIAYSRETLIGRLGVVPIPEMHLYAGIHFVTHAIPSTQLLQFQWGGSYFLTVNQPYLTPFVAADLKWKRESEADPSLNLLLGMALNNSLQPYRSFRFFYCYYTGADPRGQFYLSTFTSHSIGIEMQI